MKQRVQNAGTWAAIAALGMMMFSACGDTGVKSGTVPELEVSEGSRPVTFNGTVTVSGASQTRIRVGNRGSGDLVIRGISVDSAYPGAFEIVSLPSPSGMNPITINPNGLDHEFNIAFNQAAVPDGQRPRATVTIATNKTIDNDGIFTFYVMPEAATSKLLLEPPFLDFGPVQAQTSSTKVLTALNTGTAKLNIEKLYFSGHLGYTMRVSGTDYSVTAETSASGITFDPPLVLESGTAIQIDVTYTAAGAEAAQGSIVFMTNDPSIPNGTEAKLFANLEGPCVRVNPTRVDFGGKAVGQLSEIMLEVQSCGDVDLVISNIDIVEDPSGVFGIDKTRITALPITIEPDDSIMVPVTYFPAAVAEVGSDGQFARDIGKLRIQSNAFLADFDVDLSGFGADGRCPTAVINVAQGDEVLPQTRLNLSATNSTAAQGQITAWEWSVLQPDLSRSNFHPSAFVASPTFEANVVGTYTFRLKVFDALGNESCSQDEFIVNVTSDDAIRVELLWRTPRDSNESDTGIGAGSDVDLHFLHPRANGRYFDWTYDCYWENINPEWGFAGPSDNPRLDRDDTDGAGPENLNVATPEQNVRYQVGAHYWNDWGYGDSFATIRVYIYGVLRDQWSDIKIVNNDMWDSHYIDWPSGIVTRITTPGGLPRITPNYPVF